MTPFENSNTRQVGRHPLNPQRVIALAVVLGVVASPLAQGDDRLLFQSSTAEPYVMTLMDTSGSMAWQLDSPSAGQGGVKANRGSADDPDSRLYQAKSALYEVVRNLRPGIRLGFARFNQKYFKVYRKHWLYTRDPGLSNSDIPWFNEVPFPAAGAPVQFGHPTIDNFTFKSCSNPDNVGGPGPDDAWRINRINIFPKLGHAGTTTTTLYTRQNGNRYQIRVYGMAAGELGKDTIQVRIRVRRINSSCNVIGINQTKTLTFKPYYTQDNEGVPFRGGFDHISLLRSNYNSSWTPTVHNYGLGNIFDDADLDRCPYNSEEGWEPSHSQTHAVSYPDYSDPLNRSCGNQCFDRGDVLPWDWTDYPREPPDVGFEFNSRDEVLRRLAPNTFVAGEFDVDANGDPIPDFRIARYFEDVPVNGNLPLKAAYVNTPPLATAIASRTPLTKMMGSFEDWYDDWVQVASDETNGDPNFLCREKYVVMLTDGVETCGGNPGNAARDLKNKGIRVFVVGFGAGVDFGQLQSMADGGGTGQEDFDGDGELDCEEFGICPGPVIASNRQQLIDVLNQIFDAIQPQPTSFASAAVPQAQAESQESIFLTNFVPLDGQSVWPGTLLHFARPLPLTQNADGFFVPDENRLCDGLDPQVRCKAWDAGEKLLDQAPTATEVVTNLRLGNADNQRRVYYSKDGTGVVPNTRRLFEPPTTLADKYDLWFGMDIQFTMGDTPSETAAELEADDVIRRTLVQKTAPDPINPGQNINYILGDVFHSDPLVLGTPERFSYFVSNFESNNKACDDVAEPNPGYRCFFEKHRRRRKVVFTGSNDGQLHAFDAGFFSGQVIDGRLEGEFDLGSGKEVFSYIPRSALAGIKNLAQGRNHRFNVDGPPVIDDVFVDPAHNGTPTANERQWRTVLIAGMREGGRGYYLLDITQPDHLTVPSGQNPALPAQSMPNSQGDFVPSCIKNYTSSACGPVPYATPLWEFTDTSDEDNNAAGQFDGADLADTWSTPNTGRIRVNENGQTVVKYVAIFGGGIDPENLNDSGNWLYMVDVETGKTIYKRQLVGAAPSAPAAVDIDQDGVLDRIYIGTTRGFLYKVDISTPKDLIDTGVPAIGKRVLDAAWEPFSIFSTGDRAIFYPPSVIFSAKLGRFALGFGTGYREDLWLEETPPEQGRFYMILDDDFTAATGLTESAYQGITLGTSAGGDFLLDPSTGTGTEHGWYLILPENERAISRPFSVTGVTIFSTYVPDLAPQASAGTCSSTGGSNVYTVFATSGNAVGGPNDPRFRTVDTFLSNPFTEPSATKDNDGGSGGPTGDDLTDPLRDVMEQLKDLFPDNCKFANITINIKAIRSDTGVEFIAPVPVCIIERNWKLF